MKVSIFYCYVYGYDFDTSRNHYVIILLRHEETSIKINLSNVFTVNNTKVANNDKWLQKGLYNTVLGHDENSSGRENEREQELSRHVLR